MKIGHTVAASCAAFIAASSILVTVRLLDARDARVVNVEGEGEWKRIGAEPSVGERLKPAGGVHSPIEMAGSADNQATASEGSNPSAGSAPSLSNTDAYYAELDALREAQRLFDSDEARVVRVLKATLPSVAVTDEEWAYIRANAHIWSVEGDVLERAVEYLKPARVWAETATDDQARGLLLSQWVDPQDAAAVLRLPVDVVESECERLVVH